MSRPASFEETMRRASQLLLTDAEVARAAGLAVTTIMRIRNGSVAQPRGRTLRALQNAVEQLARQAA